MSIIPKCPICWGKCKPGQCETKQQPEALRLADWLERRTMKMLQDRQAAAELRRLHEAHEWQYTMAGERLRRIEKDEVLLRQALDTLAYWLEHGETPGAHDMIQRTHDALQERLGVPHGVGKVVGKREHITDGSPCWCNPDMTYKDPDNGAEVWVHKEPQ